VVVVSASFMLAWLRLKSDSVWPAAVFHASHNLFVPGVFDSLIRNTGSTLWYTTEFGAALAITSAVFALYFCSRRTEIRDIPHFRGDGTQHSRDDAECAKLLRTAITPTENSNG
jgi:membrane protease YdiL (CAAX protease family)